MSKKKSADEEVLRLQEFVTFQLNYTAQLMSREGSRTFASKFNVSMPQWRILASLGAEGSHTVMQLVEATQMDKGLASRIVRQLDESGLVTVKRDRSDRRVVNVNLTRKGRALFNRMRVKAFERQAELQSTLSATDKKTLFRVLRKLREASRIRLARERGEA